MKIKVISRFNDKENDLVTRTVGTVIECGEKRAAELIKKGFAVELEAEKKTKERN